MTLSAQIASIAVIIALLPNVVSFEAIASEFILDVGYEIWY